MPTQIDAERFAKPKIKSTLIKVGICSAIFAFIYIAYTIIKPFDLNKNYPQGSVAKTCSAILIAATIVSYIVLRLNKKTNFKLDLYYILALSFFIRLAYMLYTPCDVRQYDTFTKNNNGHYDYALYIFNNFRLPDHAFTEQNVYQFYHPPLYYYVAATWMKIYEKICFIPSVIADSKALFGSTQILSCFFTFLISVYALKTLLLTDLSKRGAYIAAVFCAFFPRLIQFSGQINNDVLCTLFMVLSTYRLIKWKKQGNGFVDFTLSALYLGLGMMTKLSAVILSLGMLMFFIIELYKSLAKKDGAVKLKKLLLQYSLFLLISVPIGLWFQLYAHSVYGLPYNFVFRNLNSNLFTGTRDYVLNRQNIYSVSYYDRNNSGIIYTNGFYNFLMRYISPIYLPDYSVRLFCHAFYNYNILTYAIKSAIFGEFNYAGGYGAAAVSIIFGYATWFSIVVFTAINLVKRGKADGDFNVFAYIALSIIAFYIYLQVSMPFGCSMDFRYITAILLPLGYLIGKNYDYETEKGERGTISSRIIAVSAMGFIISSSAFYLAI